jgi:hypothetical protein
MAQRNGFSAELQAGDLVEEVDSAAREEAVIHPQRHHSGCGQRSPLAEEGSVQLQELLREQEQEHERCDGDRRTDALLRRARVFLHLHLPAFTAVWENFSTPTVTATWIPFRSC